jgi:hypothetical protein
MQETAAPAGRRCSGVCEEQRPSHGDYLARAFLLVSRIRLAAIDVFS